MLSLAQLFSKIISLIKLHANNIKRVIKLIGFATLLIILKARKHDNIQTMPGWNPVTGHFHLVIKHWHHLNKYSHESVSKAGWPSIGSYTSFSASHRYITTIYDPDMVKFIWDTKFESFVKGPRIQTELAEVLGDGIFTSDPPKWKFHRKVASRMFSMRNLKDYMFECTVDHTKRVIAKINECDTNSINIYDMLSRFTLDCFTSIAFGTSVDSLSFYPKIHPFAEAFDDVISRLAIRHFVPIPLWKLGRKINEYSPFKFGNEGQIYRDVAIINEFSDKVLDSRQSLTSNLSDESGNKYNDILSLFIKYSDKKLTRDQLKYIAMNMIIAGRDTTRLLLSWFLYEMTQRADIQKKIYEEIDQYNENEMSYDDICNSLLYTECVLLETLRMNPVVPFLVKLALEDVTLPDDKQTVIRKGDEVILPTYAYSRNPKIYENPLTFNPDRFYKKVIEDGIAPINVFSVYQFPFFNINPRLCLGRKLALMESKVFVFHFFKQFKFAMTDPNQNIKIKTGIVLNMEDGLKLKVTNRRKQTHPQMVKK